MMLSCASCSKTDNASDRKEKNSVYSEYELTIDQADFLEMFIDEETAWIASLQLDNGAIPMTTADNGKLTVNPYFADISALALLDRPEKYSDNVKKYMDWHFDHLNSSDNDHNGLDGTIYDYTVTVVNRLVVNEEITVKDGKKSYDSTDSYAATFLLLLDKYYTTTGDEDYITENADDIIRIAEVIMATMNKGLTYAKPDYEVKYLMDNCEVYDGLRAVINLFDNVIFKDNTEQLTYKKFKYAYERVEQSIEQKLWNADAGYYHSAILADGDPAYKFSWQEFYPSAAAQLFPVVHNCIDADSIRAVSLYHSFCENYNWQDLEIPSDFCWAVIAMAAAKMNDTVSVLSYINSYQQYAAERQYPLYNADAARASMAAAILLNK